MNSYLNQHTQQIIIKGQTVRYISPTNNRLSYGVVQRIIFNRYQKATVLVLNNRKAIISVPIEKIQKEGFKR